MSRRTRLRAVRRSPGIGTAPAPAAVPIATTAEPRGASRVAPPLPEPSAASGGDDIAAAVTDALRLAAREFREGRVGSAVELCDAALALRPGDAEALHLLALILHRCERWEEAATTLRRAIAAHPAPPGVYRAELALMLLELGRPEEATTVCGEALARDRDNPHLLCVLGLARRQMGRLASAVAALDRAVNAPGATPEMHAELARAYMAVGRYGDALVAYTTALSRGGQAITNRYIAAYATSTVRDWCLSTGSPYRTLLGAAPGRTFLPRYEGRPGGCEPVPLERPEVYIAELSDVTVVGGLGPILTPDGTALFDPVFLPAADRFDLAGPLLPYVDRRGALIDVPARAVTLETGILLSGFGAANYYHWVIEQLPRLLAVELAGVPEAVPLLVDAATLAVPQLVDALRAVDRAGRPVLELAEGLEHRVARLYVPGPLAWAAPNLRDNLQLGVGDNLVAREAIEFLRARLGAPEDAVGWRRLYVARRARTVQRLLNEPEVRAVFEEAGFEVVWPEELSFAEQRALFAEAAVVAGESGAGLTNLVFAPRSAILVCLQAEAWPMNVYADLAGHAGQTTVFVTGTLEGERPRKPYQARFTMDAGTLRRRLPELLGEGATSGRPA